MAGEWRRASYGCVQGGRDRYARRGRHLPRRVHVAAGGERRCRRRDAVCLRRGSDQMHALRRADGRGDARGGRGVSAGACVELVRSSRKRDHLRAASHPGTKKSISAARSARSNGLALSNARAARSTSMSLRGGPTICNASGRPSFENPHGTDAAGCCVKLNGYVYGDQASHSSPKFPVSRRHTAGLERRDRHLRRQQQVVLLVEAQHVLRRAQRGVPVRRDRRRA